VPSERRHSASRGRVMEERRVISVPTGGTRVPVHKAVVSQRMAQSVIKSAPVAGPSISHREQRQMVESEAVPAAKAEPLSHRKVVSGIQSERQASPVPFERPRPATRKRVVEEPRHVRMTSRNVQIAVQAVSVSQQDARPLATAAPVAGSPVVNRQPREHEPVQPEIMRARGHALPVDAMTRPVMASVRKAGVPVSGENLEPVVSHLTPAPGSGGAADAREPRKHSGMRRAGSAGEPAGPLSFKEGSGGALGGDLGSSTNSSPEQGAPAICHPPPGSSGRMDFGWLGRVLRERVEEIKLYSVEARLNKWEGRVVLAAAILADGRIVDVRVAESSGNPQLDDDARAIVDRASPINLSRTLGAPKVPVKIPIIFELH
jgi:periplasmic protein TonB